MLRRRAKTLKTKTKLRKIATTCHLSKHGWRASQRSSNFVPRVLMNKLITISGSDSGRFSIKISLYSKTRFSPWLHAFKAHQWEDYQIVSSCKYWEHQQVSWVPALPKIQNSRSKAAEAITSSASSTNTSSWRVISRNYKMEAKKKSISTR